MAHYRFEFFDEPDDENTHELDRLGGRPRGIATGDWPRSRGAPMQHFITVDLGRRPVWQPSEAPIAANARAVAVFVDSYLETDNLDPEGIAVRFVDQASIDAIGETAPPDDFVEEPWSESSYRHFSMEAVDDAPDDSESYLGGAPAWPEETGAPDAIPGGAFVMRISCDDARFNRESAHLMVFEQGAIAVPQYEPDEWCPPVSWREALVASRELIVIDQAPAPGAVVKYGGAPRAIEYWPTDSRDRPLTHLMTLPVELLRDDQDDTVAIAYFIDRRRVGLADWDREPAFFDLQWVTRELLDDDGYQVELPEGTEHLPERALELRPFDEDLNWRDLLGKSFVGPRGVFRNPTADCANPGVGHELQIEASFLPGVSREGTLYLAGGSAAYQRDGDTGRGNHYDDTDGFDDFGFDPYEDEGGGDGGEAELSAGLRVLRRGSGPAAGARSWAGGLPPDIGLDAWPRFEGELMTHVLTIAFADVPDLAGAKSAGASVFLSTANHHQAFSPYSDHAAVVLLTAGQLASRAKRPEGNVLEVLDAFPLELVEHDDSPPWSFAGGSPRWIQAPQWAGPFVAQFVDEVIDVNLGDSGALYIFGDTAFMQCY
jgi:hypothetical protein